ncbi:MAG: metallophosphoesterase family protein [Bacillota bacterium]
MRPIKILHCGDMHFDTPFSGLSPKDAEKRKEDLRETFGKIIGLVKEEAVELLLISGDLFDSSNITKTTIDYILEKLKEVPDVHVFISPGNHDPYTDKSYYKLIPWPPHVHIFSPTLEKIEIPQKKVWVYGTGFGDHYMPKALIEDFQIEEDDHIHIMVIHGDVVAQGQSSDYNPVTENTIRNSGLDYLALGHQHRHTGIKKAGKTFWSYPGNPEGRGFDELGPKGVLIGEVGKDYCNLRFVETCKRKYIEERIDISGAFTYEEISGRILQNIDLEEDHKHLYRIILTGEIHEEFNIHTHVIQEKLRDKLFWVSVKDETTVKMNEENLERDFSLKGVFVKKMREKIKHCTSDEERQKLEQALKIGIYALNDREAEIL